MRSLRWRVAKGRGLSCRDVGDLLQRHLDAEVHGRLADQVAAHLEDCRRCGLEAAVYEEIKAALAREAVVLPDSAVMRLRGFAARLVDGVPGS